MKRFSITKIQSRYLPTPVKVWILLQLESCAVKMFLWVWSPFFTNGVVKRTCDPSVQWVVCVMCYIPLNVPLAGKIFDRFLPHFNPFRIKCDHPSLGPCKRSHQKGSATSLQQPEVALSQRPHFGPSWRHCHRPHLLPQGSASGSSPRYYKRKINIQYCNC